MIQDIAEFLSGKGLKVCTYQTAKPDVVFELGKKKVAVEVETGKILKKDKVKMKNKVQLLKRDYDSWFFVMTDPNNARKYKEFGKTIDKRGLANYLKKLLKNVSS